MKKRNFLLMILSILLFSSLFTVFSKPVNAATTFQPYLDTTFLDAHLTVVTSKSNSNYGLTDFSAYTKKKSNWLYEYTHTAKLTKTYNGKNTVIFNKNFSSSTSYVNYLGKGSYHIIVTSTERNKLTGKKTTVFNQSAWVIN